MIVVRHSINIIYHDVVKRNLERFGLLVPSEQDDQACTWQGLKVVSHIYNQQDMENTMGSMPKNSSDEILVKEQCIIDIMTLILVRVQIFFL